MKTWSLHIYGLVQGVGFRPFVFGLAQEMQVNGRISNGCNGVHIHFNADSDLCARFHNRILKSHPPKAHITGYDLKEEKWRSFDDFKIEKSKNDREIDLIITPDFATCSNCKEDIIEEDNRRLDYAFTTCTDCGPRYSITSQLPFDRENTEMDIFPMCSSCHSEYDNHEDRRFYSQTNSCHSCGIQMELWKGEEKIVNRNGYSILDQVVEAWEKGLIVAIKGIGGYLLTCNASNAASIDELRKRKHRSKKPFAVMYADIEQVKGYHISEQERNALLSPAAPIVLLKNKEDNILPDNIAPQLKSTGVLIAYTPLYNLLLSKFQKPIIATSGNISNEPIIYSDDDSFKLNQIADLVLTNNRNIATPQDDSVIKYARESQERIVIRRSRGLAPSHAKSNIPASGNILAIGAMLKSTFSIQQRQNFLTSQYIGDLQSFTTEANYKDALQHLVQLLNFEPTIILADQHKGYASTRIGEELANSNQVELEYVQHHHAHFAAVLGENELIDTQAPILGVIWDGTGLGDDKNIWGGEFFTYEFYKMKRCNHFSYFPAIAIDKMAKEPRISALILTNDHAEGRQLVDPKFTPQELSIYTQLLSNNTTLHTSSVGRIFDAVASLLGLTDIQSYEGEAAIQLEQLARDYFDQNGFTEMDSYPCTTNSTISSKGIIRGVESDMVNNQKREYIAARFHYSLIQIIRQEAERRQLHAIACSGGVFQNSVLIDLLHIHLSSEYNIYLHKDLSPNDENISYGQIIYHHIEESRQRCEKISKIQDCNKINLENQIPVEG